MSLRPNAARYFGIILPIYAPRLPISVDDYYILRKKMRISHNIDGLQQCRQNTTSSIYRHEAANIMLPRPLYWRNTDTKNFTLALLFIIIIIISRQARRDEMPLRYNDHQLSIRGCTYAYR